MIAGHTTLNRIVRTLAHPKRYNLWPHEQLEFETANCLEDTIQIRVTRWVGGLTRDNPTYRHAVAKVPVLDWRRFQVTGNTSIIIETVEAILDHLVALVRTLPVPFRLRRKGKRYLQTNEQIWHETKEVPGRRENYWALFRQDQRRTGQRRGR